MCVITSYSIHYTKLYDFADRLNKFSGLEIKEAENGDELRPGRVLIAPGGANLTLRRRGDAIYADVREPDHSQRYVPSVDHLFRSAAEHFEDRLLGIVLTGRNNFV